MAIIPDDMLRLAGDLLTRIDGLPDVPDREALCRAAVGRAYYAAYHAALSLARRQGFEGRLGMGSHEALWDGWFGEREEDGDLADAGHALKLERRRADYRLRETFAPSSTRATVEAARGLLDLVRAR